MLRRTYLICNLFIFIQSNSTTLLDGNIADDWFNQEKVAVSLGYDCTVAGQLKNEHLRIRAFPFDWCFSDIEGIIACIKNEFKDFILFHRLTWDERILVKDAHYNITIVHDFPFQQIRDFTFQTMHKYYSFKSVRDLIQDQYHEVYQKYMRRIERFKQLKFFKGKAYFIRFGRITKNQSLELYNVLRNFLNHNNFTLVVIGDTNEFSQPWNIPNIINIFMKKPQDMFAKGVMTKAFAHSGLL